jgi:hypothetical protein
MKKYSLIIFAALMASYAFAEQFMPKGSYVPPAGFVPDAETAISIARAVWIPIYGAKQIDRQKPYEVTLTGDVWTVTGSLPKGYSGGVAGAEISKRDGRVIRVSHDK